MQAFSPNAIYVARQVEHLPLTRRVLAHFNDVPVHPVENPESLKKPIPMGDAKKALFITRSVGHTIKTCQGMGDYVCCNYLTMSLISNCHLECTYCILQDYLKNNPIITLFANIEEILDSIHHHIAAQPDRLFRLGTGELSDSLALDSITRFTEELVPFAKTHSNLLLELKTKSDQVDNLLELDHGGRVVVSWSLNPQQYIDWEELKCASLNDRLNAARKVADAGYPVAFHFDPLLALTNWQSEYQDLVEQVRDRFRPEEIAWFSLGSLRYTPGLKTTMKARFPKSHLLYGEMFPSEDGKIRYFREIREMLYSHVKGLLDQAFAGVPNYLCMETSKVWERVFKSVPPSTIRLEERIAQRFSI